ncbi:hypothetical protein fHeYen902_064c [Yersinia phage fHe-Yen9-02]|nr:hypothetical protein fHeYen902_064c [Yersinia phage fHe-Yen9-02]
MKKCRLPKTVNVDVNFELNSVEVINILKRVDSVTRFSDSDDKLTHIHLLVGYQGDVFIIGRTPDTFVAHHVPAGKCDKDTVFNIDPTQLIGLLNKRGDVDLLFTGKEGQIVARQGKYKSDFKVRALSSEQIPMVSEGLRHHTEGGHAMTREVIDKLIQGIRLTRLKDPLTNAPVMCRVDCRGDELRISSPGNWTSAQYVAPLTNKTNKFRFSLTGEMFDLITKFCGEEQVSFHADAVSFAAEADSFVVTLPPIQSNDEDYRYIDTLLSQLGKPLIGVVVKGDIGAPFANIATLVEKKGNTKATVKLRKKEMRIKFSSDSGSAQDSLTLAKPVEKEFETSLDMRVMRDILRNIGKEERHAMGFHGPNIKELKAFTLNYKQDTHSLLYFGYIPA